MKSVSTNDLYQSTFMPQFQEAETKIKKIILTAFLLMISLDALMKQITSVIRETEKHIPTNLKDRENYINGLWMSSQKLIKRYYYQPKLNFINTKEKVLKVVEGKKPDIKTPVDLVGYIEDNKPQLDMWAEQKGVPYVENYGKKVQERITQLSNEEITTSETGKKPISLWQKAELDVRHENQVKMLDDLLASGVEYAWISSHPNCSVRCETWQGELVSLTKRAVSPQSEVKNFKYNKSSYLVEKLDGHNVYSLQDIMATETGYGYTNNIINGFNCRHHLTPYKKGSSAPTEYNEEDIRKQRLIEQRIRDLERDIRKKKANLVLLENQYRIYNKVNDTTSIKELKKKIENLKATIKRLVAYYKKFCEKYGYAWYEYRIS